MTQHVAIVQDLTDLSVKLVGPGAMQRIAEINESHYLYVSTAYCQAYLGMSHREALRRTWRELKLETQPV